MPKCKGCGIELLEGTVFCPYCGQAVEENEKPAEPIIKIRLYFGIINAP